MPTGYTSPIIDDASFTFEQFVWRCARGFGALHFMRDEPLDANIPEAAPHQSYEADQLKKHEADLAALNARTDQDWMLALEEDAKQERDHYERSIETMNAKRSRYMVMLDRVMAWEPPSENHAELKRFMVEQLEFSIRFDCYDIDPPRVRTIEEYRVEKLAFATRMVLMYREGAEKEQTRNASQDEWLRLLRGSVPVPEKSSELRPMTTDTLAG